MSRPESWVVLEDQQGASSGICFIKKNHRGYKINAVLLKKIKTWGDTIISCCYMRKQIIKRCGNE